ncbi:MAG: glycosyltransferase [Suipraeoptans sp.]
MSMREIKVSVVMGVYNPRNTKQLFQAIDSIINQSFTDWEMIICDDGSDKKYVKLIKEVSGRDNRIKYLRYSKNKGLAHALNVGVANSKGKYIARMDADDISNPNRLVKEYRFLEYNPRFQWVGSNAYLIDDKGIWGDENVKKIPKKEDFLEYSPYIHPSVMFRREALELVGGYTVSKDTARCEDYELFMRLHEQGLEGYNIKEKLLEYRFDDAAHLKRRYKYSISEMKVRYVGFRKLGILKIRTSLYVIRPLFAWLFRVSTFKYLMRKVRNG